MSEEKKLTDEEILKAWDNCGNYEGCPNCPLFRMDCHNLIKGIIHRLQDENEQLKKDRHDMSWIIKVHKYCVGADHCQNSSTREFELQKQVDELKTENKELYKEHTTLIAGSILKQQDIVKDTAREIYGEIGDNDILIVDTKEYGEIEVVPIERLKEIINSKGVEVDYEN